MIQETNSTRRAFVTRVAAAVGWVAGGTWHGFGAGTVRAAQTDALSKRVSGFLKRSDAEIYYEVTGSGPALVFAHGGGGHYLSWWQQIPYFSQRFTCVTFSHRYFRSIY